MKESLRPPLTYYGGKQRMAQLILSYIPPHTTYVESFFGGGAVYFAKDPSKIEIINDTNHLLIIFYEVLKNNYTELKKEIDATLFSRYHYEKAITIYRDPSRYTKVNIAWSIWCMCALCFLGLLGAPMSASITSNTCPVRLTNKKKDFIEKLAERLENTHIENNDGIQVIQKFDTPKTFHYIDPPYFNSKMGHYKTYTKEEFVALLHVLSYNKGTFLLSSYPSDELDEYTYKNNWYTKTLRDHLTSPDGKRRRKKTEVLTTNYPLVSDGCIW